MDKLSAECPGGRIEEFLEHFRCALISTKRNRMCKNRKLTRFDHFCRKYNKLILILQVMLTSAVSLGVFYALFVKELPQIYKSTSTGEIVEIRDGGKVVTNLGALIKGEVVWTP